ncbi:MAG: TonB-dependent receptor [Bryobacteraceae bacterium]
MRLITFSLLALLAPVRMLAQSAGESSELSGTIRDSSGGAIANVAVTLRNPETGLERKAETGADGVYRFLRVAPALYEVQAEKQSFRTKVAKDVRLTIGQAATLDFTLELGVVSETIEVTGGAALIESERTQQSNTLEQQFVRNLPIDRRDYLSFTLLAPGVVDSNAMADNSDFRVTATPQSGLSFYGSNGRGNSVTVDGGETNDSAGGVRPNLSQEAVEEFQVNRSNYSAELGGASGGVINIVSKTGTNRVRGSAFGYFRHQALDAGDPFARLLQSDGSIVRVKPDATRQQYGGSLGGPIQKDKTFFFFAYEGLNRDESNVVSVLTDRSIFGPTREQEAILSRLPAAAAQQLRAALTSPPSTIALFEQNSGISPFTSRENKVSVRLDHNWSSKHQTFLRYGFAGTDDSNASTRALVGSSRGSDFKINTSTIAAGWTASVSARTVNDLRAQFNYHDQKVSSLEPYGPELNIAGFGFFNKDIFLPNHSILRRTEIKDSFSTFRGAHTLKAGAQVNIRNEHANTQTFFGGRFGFGPLPAGLVNAALASTTITALQAFNLGLPQSYQQGFGDPVVKSTYPYYGFFVQDSWKVRPNLTFDMGVRYEIDTRKAPLPTDKNNVAPRFGFAWDPFHDGKTTVRGGYGIYYSPIYFQIDYVVNALGEINGKRQIPQVLTTIQTAGPAAANNIYATLRRQGVITIPKPTRRIEPADLTQFGITISQTGPTPPFSVIFDAAPNYVNPYSQQGTLGIERQIGNDVAISVSGIWARTLKISRARDTNLLPAPVNPQLGIRVWRTQDFVNPLIFQRNVYESTARSFYGGGILEIRKRFSKRLSVAGNYTFSKATDEVTDYNSDFQPFDQADLRGERALSAFDQRHKVVIYGTSELPYGIVLSPIFRANSGRPFNLLAGVDVNADRHSTTDRPIGAGRNTGRGPGFYTFDLRIGKRISFGERRYLELTAEGFNLTNHLNYASINNTVGLIQGPFNLTGRHDRSPSEPLGFTSAFDARRLQLGIRLSF